MTAQNPTVQAFVKLGEFIQDFCENRNEKATQDLEQFSAVLRRAEQQNAWFTEENILYCLKHWGNLLTEDSILSWLSNYNLGNQDPKTIGVVMAGNIPLVGFHDFICVLLTGHRIQAKLSSNDTILLPFLADHLVKQHPNLKDEIVFADGQFDHFDAVIATGSNNTSRYFEHYFGKRPNIIRKNRNAVAVLTGNESPEELEALGEDIFRYYGLGCRNVSKIYIPKAYDFDVLFKGLFAHKDIINQHKYANNYDYNKAVYLMSEFNILDNGFIVLKEDTTMASPIASLFYEYYDSLAQLKNHLLKQQEELQCVVSKDVFPNEVAFGQTQQPKLHDYADGVDTIQFLIDL